MAWKRNGNAKSFDWTGERDWPSQGEAQRLDQETTTRTTLQQQGNMAILTGNWPRNNLIPVNRRPRIVVNWTINSWTRLNFDFIEAVHCYLYIPGVFTNTTKRSGVDHIVAGFQGTGRPIEISFQRASTTGTQFRPGHSGERKKHKFFHFIFGGCECTGPAQPKSIKYIWLREWK